MTISNTKLNNIQKPYLKRFKANFPNAMFFSFPESRITVLMQREFINSKMVMVSTSTASQNELKFRRKVGEYYAVSNFENGGGIKLEILPGNEEEFAADLADTLYYL